MIFDLNSPSIAQYHWGTLICRFSSAAPVSKKTFLKTVASLGEKVAPWATDEEFRATAAFLHEIVHLAQDLTTGLGHSDFLVHRFQNGKLLRHAAHLMRSGDVDGRPPYRRPGAPGASKDSSDSTVAEVQDRLGYYPFSMVPRERRERIRRLLQEELGRPVDENTLSDFSVQSILESDAALTTICELTQLQMTDEQQAILKRNSSIVDREMLGPEYWGAVHHLESVLAHHADLDDRQMEVLVPRTFGLLVDSALAYSPIEWAQTRGASADAFDPGVKYVRLLIAFQRLVGTAMEQFWHALLAGRNGEAEAILLKHTSHPYPESSDIYRNWAGVLETMVNDSVAAEVRHAACRYRLDQRGLQLRRGIDLLFDMQAPILYLHSDNGFVKHDWGVRAVDEERSVQMTQEWIDHFMMMELVEFFFRTGEFRCPHAHAGICAVVEDGCMAGFVHPAQIPVSTGCVARSVLAQCGMEGPGGQVALEC